MSNVTYIVHESPIGCDSSNYIAMANLAPYSFADSMEQMWLRSIDRNGYQVSCIPFRVYGLALGDTVELDPEGKQIMRLIRRSGHRVFRIFLPPSLSGPELNEMRDAVVRAIANDDLKSEWSGDRHVAIDLPAGREVRHVWQVVKDAAEQETHIGNGPISSRSALDKL